MEIVEPHKVKIDYPIVPLSVFKHHTTNLEAVLTMLICRIHESNELGEMNLLSNSAYLLMLSSQLTSILAQYQGDLIHAYNPTETDENLDYM
jgi:hypothetical protein